MSYTTLSKALIESMDLLAKQQADSKAATLTVEAKINEIIDAGKGLYEVEYLSNKFEALAANAEITYDIDEIVYVVVPNGNFDNTKIILAPVDSQTATYASTEKSKIYVPIGNSLFINNSEISLCSYTTSSIEYNPLDINTGEENSEEIKEDFIKSFNNSLKDSRFFNFSCKIKTNIEKERRINGNYGLILSIPVIQNQIETYYKVVLDRSSILGDFYNFSVYALQNHYFELPEDMIYDSNKIPLIYAFVENFPIGESEVVYPDDIWIKDISLISTKVLEEEEITGYYLTLTASSGSAFISTLDSNKIITPTLYLNGRLSSFEGMDCYWFKENCQISNTDDKFYSLGGLGWEILNDKTDVSISEGGEETYQYVTNVYSLTVRRSDVHSYTRYKCILVNQKGTVISQIITIRNLNSLIELSLTSATGSNKYTENVGEVHLLVRYYDPDVTNRKDEEIPPSVCYAWQRFDKAGNYIDNIIDNLDTKTIKYNEKVVEEIGEEEKIYYETEISFPTSRIDKMNTIYCTAYLQKSNIVPQEGQEDKYLIQQAIIGTKSIMITTDLTFDYIIKVNNGDKLYKYDADGDSPMIADYDGPLSSVVKQIPPINIELFKADGTEFTEDEYSITEIEWLVPINSMIVIDSSNQTDTEKNPGYYTISGRYNSNNNLSYTIIQTYDNNKQDNTIIIKAYFKNKIIESVANIRFIKDGMAGTNGSKYSAIVTYKDCGYGEKTSEGKIRKVQLIYAEQQKKWYSYDTGEEYSSNNPIELTNNNAIILGLDLYCDGKCINKGTVEASDIVWTVFDDSNYYNNIKNPFKTLRKSEDNKTINLVIDTNARWNWSNSQKDNISVIIQAKCKAQKSSLDSGITNSEEYVYAYYPIEATFIKDFTKIQNGIIPTMEGGFSQVVYASDGTNPQYDSSSDFVMKDSMYNNDMENLYDYDWSAGSEEDSNLEIYNNVSNSCQVSPITKYDNGISNNFVRAILGMSIQKKNEIKLEAGKYAKKVAENHNYQEYYKILQENKQVLSDFKYTEYKNKLKKASDKFFTVKKEFVKEIGNLNKILNSLLTYCKTYYDTSTYANKVYSVVNNLRLNIGTLNYTAGKLGIEEDAYQIIFNNYKPENICININDTNLTRTYTDTKVNRAIKDKMTKYNNEVNTIYNSYFYQIFSTNNEETTDFYKAQLIVEEVISDIRSYLADVRWYKLTSSRTEEYINYIQVTDEEGELVYELDGSPKIIEQSPPPTVVANKEVKNYTGILNNLKGYLDSMGITYNIYSYNDLINKVLTPMNKLLSDNSKVDYTKTIKNYHINYLKYNNLYNACMAQIADENATEIIHIKPVIMLYNRYELSSINGWDGNKLKIDDDKGEYILAPQVGAGRKENGKFTGILMGIKQPSIKSNDSKMGLFGYNKGVESLFINSQDGSASFGVKGDGQILIEPSSRSAIIKSGNYNPDATPTYIEYNYVTGNPKSQNLYEVIPNSNPVEYRKTSDTTVIKGKTYYIEVKNSGMQIDLSKPEIRFGSGNFVVDEKGQIYANNSTFNGSIKASTGSIGGWTIGTNALFNSTADASIYTGDHSAFGSTKEGFYLSNKGFSAGDDFSITSSGRMFASGSTFAGKITAKTGFIGGWTLNANSLSNSTTANSSIWTGNHTAFGSTSNGFYLGDKGFSIGNGFSVTSDGKMTAKSSTFSGIITATSSTFSGRITATSGSIGGWTLKTNALSTTADASIYTGDHTAYRSTSDGFYLGKSGFSVGDDFSVTSNGRMTAKSSTFVGRITATTGSIGGWTLGTNALSSTTNSSIYTGSHTAYNTTFDGFYLGKNGFSIGKGFSVTPSGKMTAVDATFTGDIVGSSSLKLQKTFEQGITQTLNIDAGLITVTAPIRQVLAGTAGINVTTGGAENTGIGPGALIVSDSTSSITRINGGNLSCSGTKNRIVSTEHYNKILLNAYETPRPTFSDEGHGVLDNSGLCYIYLDDIFIETIDLTHNYRIFLTKYSKGDIWVNKVTSYYVIIEGTPNLEFDWKIDCIQKDHNLTNLEPYNEPWQ